MLVLEAGFLTTIQDLGREGFEHLGVPVAGAMDRFALMAVNALVGSQAGAAGLECALAGCVLLAEEEALVAAGGVGFCLEVGGRRVLPWMAAYARPGEAVALVAEAGAAAASAPPWGAWGYLAFGGGIDVPLVMGSRSTYLRGGFGGLAGRALRPGDRFGLGPGSAASLRERAGRCLPESCLPAYGAQTPIAAIPGPQADAFSAEALELFFSAEFTLSPACDRMGYRLSGPAIPHRAGPDLLSEGAPLGAVQVPGDGQPIVLMADRQATGGYVKIATVASADLPVLAQRLPGAPVRFRLESVAEAQKKWRRLVEGLREIGRG